MVSILGFIFGFNFTGCPTKHDPHGFCLISLARKNMNRCRISASFELVIALAQSRNVNLITYFTFMWVALENVKTNQDNTVPPIIDHVVITPVLYIRNFS